LANAAPAAWFGAFEEPPRMSSARNTCLQKADDAKQRAAQATEAFMKSAYEKVAEHWILARLRPRHSMRYSAGSESGRKCRSQCHDTRALQAWLGHRNIQHTVRYTELAPDRFKNFWRD
jgi:integrase